jgi:four helix bundle protein
MVVPMDAHRQLPVWQDARKLVALVYRVTRALPRDEYTVVVPQLRRAAWSVTNNIAEGNAKLGRAERRRFLDIAIGSLAEVDSMIGILPDNHAVDAGLVEQFNLLRSRINRGLFAMLRSRPPR